MVRQRGKGIIYLLGLLILSLQSCSLLGGDSQGNFQTSYVSSAGTPVAINQTARNTFQGHIYFTLHRDLAVIDGKLNVTRLTQGLDVRDPSISPDGRWIAFQARYKNYSDLMLMPTQGGKPRVLRTGAGIYESNPGFAPHATYLWYAQPAWAPDNKHLLFLSDYDKQHVTDPNVDAFLIDPQIFSIQLDHPDGTPQEIAYATYGDGGLRDPVYRPGHSDQIAYTNFTYDSSRIKQSIQIYLEDPNAIAHHPDKYRPGDISDEFDPAVALTPRLPDLANMQPAFSPDGNAIAYIRRLDANHMGLFVMPVPPGASTLTQVPNNAQDDQRALEGYSKSIQLVTGEYISNPIWSPDGKYIAYTGYANNTFDIWLAPLKRNAQRNIYSLQGQPVQLTNANGQLDADSRPFWSS
ncbi:hypothetical protein EPA93_08550 [Ktedonosporobacter rubrisoli]|uniref:Dipeptidylpeptidase IV N-terminal domain-containing protein n=1 Tax=Ktedonosporobacter rubrisoli TaxID=2509675 RepID=A0A4P6JM27_KTERU|nr:PD40 domain-containing protein [Ktedonosporobacter rubrisoli]QBD76052.1 hypothetical protein EPA93_08550 [Ktedonosporobacter rubrisoli]